MSENEVKIIAGAILFMGIILFAGWYAWISIKKRNAKKAAELKQQTKSFFDKHKHIILPAIAVVGFLAILYIIKKRR